ncbi:MAG: type II toxin-antitoxin system VapC family toxin [Syntrophobacterales bacterium]|nr:type II toxin-antitoxin system VapC family toxin [Syntrophobacterales bacterium]
MIVLDTHVWIWWVSSPSFLSETAKTVIDGEVTKKEIFISSISVWEIAILVSRGRLKLTMSDNDWVTASEALPFLNFVPVNNSIAMKSVNLPGILHNDPADRIIIATALSLGAVLVTKDEKIRNYPHVKTAW